MINITELYKEITDFKKGYKLRTDIVKDEKGYWFTDSHSIFARWRNHFSELFSVRGASNVRQAEIHKTEPLAYLTSAFEVEMTIEKLKKSQITRY